MRIAVAAIAFLCLFGSTEAENPEREGSLPVNGGLVLWLNADDIDSSITTSAGKSLDDGERIAAWRDRSPNKRDFVQVDTERQPRRMQIDDAWIVRFDGDATFMRCESVSGQLTAATAFIVASAHDNRGDFRGLLAANSDGKRDYESGFTIDLGPDPTQQFEQINVEGKGFGGASDLFDQTLPFGTLSIIETTIDPEQRLVSLSVDGKPALTRPFEPATISIGQLTLGARYYTNGPGEQMVRGPFRGDMAEVLVYDRVLNHDEIEKTRDYLRKKHAKLAAALPLQLKLNTSGTRLVKAENPPAIQMLIPGFSFHELPIDLPNVNNVRFRDDGRLMTLGYNGDLHLLSDTDGDGLEDHAESFWNNEGRLRGPLGLVLTPPNYPKGRGAFVPSKGKVSLIVDTNGDDKADEEIIVAKGWEEIPQNVDAVGIAMGPDGSIYFGLGTANYANAYLIDEKGKAAYDLKSDRGTVQRVAPDFSRRETVCTGIRFPIAFAFNRAGDLFCSEQEGATWLPNGNPLDELLHIQSGRHYGFPPRHPTHNPDVLDEPSTFDYGPQHQSTCGMVFNESVNGGPVFGPTNWTGNAIVCGESRGKLWCTKLVKTEVGYVAATQLFAALQMLTVDACVAPNGDLVVACHSGGPDWGTGPTGRGKLYRIKFTQSNEPQPIATWAESPTEIRVAFDRPLDPLRMRNLAEQVRVEYGDFVRAGDRFENLVPPYAVVQRQLLAPRFELPVLGASITSDLRTLIVSTNAMRSSVHYAITIPRESSATVDPSEEHHVDFEKTDLDFTLNGVQATWTASTRDAPITPGTTTWLPHLNLSVARELTKGSEQHQSFWNELGHPGVLQLQTRLDVNGVLRPKVQPGAKLDYQWPQESVTILLRSPQPIAVVASAGEIKTSSQDGSHEVRLQCPADLIEGILLDVKLTSFDSASPELTISLSTNEDSRLRPLPLHRFTMPWAQEAQSDDSSNEPIRIAQLEGGNWGKGRQVFHGEAASCSKCHSVGGGGSKIGPDLGNLVHRDYPSVMRDIISPSFAINPDFIGHVIALNDGRVMAGILQTTKEEWVLADNKGTLTTIDRSQVESTKLSDVSVMPIGLSEKLTEAEMRDLMTFLLTEPPHMPLDAPLDAPPLRSQAEVAAALAGAPTLPNDLRPLQIVLVAGPKDHGPGEHDYPAWQVQWAQLLAAARNVNVSIAWEFPSKEQLASADVLIFFQKGNWDDDRALQLDRFQSRGGGAVYIHWAVNGNDRVADFSDRIGLASRGGSIRYRHGALKLDLHNADHPILRNLSTIQLYDESYWLLTGNPEKVILLATSTEDGAEQPQVWTYEKGNGRVFVSIPGHYSWTFDDPFFRILLLRGIAWTAREPIDRFNELVPLGARMSK